MRCDETTKLLLDGRTDDPGLKEHLCACPECRATAELFSRLADEGEALRTGDLSPEAIEATRERAARALAANDARPARSILRWPQPRPAPAAAAVVVLAAGVALFLGREKALPEHPTSDELAMRKEITQLRCSIMDRLGEFRHKYQAQGRVSHFAERRRQLRNKINVVSFKVKRDLAKGAKSGPLPAGAPGTRKHAMNAIPAKGKTQDEDTAQDEQANRGGTGSTGGAAAVTHSTRPGAKT